MSRYWSVQDCCWVEAAGAPVDPDGFATAPPVPVPVGALPVQRDTASEGDAALT